MDIAKLKQDVSTWADSIPYSVALFLFGSCLNGKSNPNDIDIAIVFTESLSKIDLGCIAVEDASAWEMALAKKTKLPIHLQIYDPWHPGNLREYLINGPVVLLYLSKAPKNHDEDFEKDLALLMSKE